MKKFTRTMALALVTAMLLSMTAFAAPTVKPEDGKTVTPGALANNDKSFESITYADGRIVTDGQYMIFVVDKDEDGDYFPTASSILYINQKQAAAEDTITFENIFPKEMKNSGIMISGNGFDLPTLIAKILAALLGDLDESGTITAYDALQIQRFAASLDSLITEENAEWLSIADVDNSGTITAYDALQIQRFAAGLESVLN